MPVYVPHYKHDIFVSYAQVDDEPLLGADNGWVTTLINGLKTLLRQKLGPANAYSLWLDHELRGQQTVTSTVETQLTHSAIFLLVLSPAYLASEWCLHELKTFLSLVGTDSERIFLIERDEVLRPVELNDLLGYKFWFIGNHGKPRTLGVPKPTAEEIEYYQKLNDLAYQLVDKLKFLKTEIERSQKDLTTKDLTTFEKLSNLRGEANLTTFEKLPNLKGEADLTTFEKLPNLNTLFLAEVTADLEPHRNDVKRYFGQQGFRVLPNRRYPFAQIQQYLEEDLTQSQLFIQLLSENNGNEYPLFQYQRACAAKLPIFQWREPTLNLNLVTETNHRALLESSTVISSSLIEFQTHILQQLKPKPEVTIQKTLGEILVFINAAPEDMALVYEIKTIFDAHGLSYSLPLVVSETTKSTTIRQYLEQNLLYSDVVLVLYDKSSIVWVTEQLLYSRKIQGRREQPLKFIAVYQKPSPQQPALPIKFPNLRLLECSTPQSSTCLPTFLQALQT